jgi:hypothetical protein
MLYSDLICGADGHRRDLNFVLQGIQAERNVGIVQAMAALDDARSWAAAAGRRPESRDRR